MGFLGKRSVSIAEFCFAKVLRLFPHRYRFGISIIIAHLVVPLFRYTAVYKRQMSRRVDGPYEITLHFILNALTRNGTEFDPVIKLNGYENFERAATHEGGVLVIGPHAALNLMLVRLFYENGYDPIVITADQMMRIAGTSVVSRTIQTSPTFLIKTRNSLRQGNIICAMPDRLGHHATRTVEVDTANGSVIFAPALLQVAAKCGASIIFTEVHFEKHKLVSNIVAAQPIIDGNIDFLIEDFKKFIQWHVESHVLNSPRNKNT